MSQNMDKRIILYPSYLDSTQTVAEGRVLSKEQACNTPDVMEMLECCKQLNLQADIENKQYPRAWWIPGRLRVALKRPDGSPANAECPTKRALMVKIAAMIKSNPNRPKKVNIMQAAAAASAAAAANTPAGSAAGASSSGKTATTSSSTTSNKKKKGKK